MEPKALDEMSLVESRFCPECGTEEAGHFCRNCGTLLAGEDMVLCPRCHQVVPAGGFCNQCGQSLTGVALNLRQLALAGDEFWVTAAAGTPPAAPPPGEAPGLWAPDESLPLAEAELPDWLHELPTESAPAEVQARIYPALRPISEPARVSQQGRFLAMVILLMGLLLLSLVAMALIFLLRGG